MHSDPTQSQRGFTLIEMVIAISILAILGGALAPALQQKTLRARDSRRITDIQTVTAAIDEYYADLGRWPAAIPNLALGGWDVSFDGNFISELRETGYLQADVFDPINNSDYHYRYYVYAPGAHGCQGEEAYYVIGIRNFESQGFEAGNQGFFQCSGRDWGDEFAYVTGAGARP